MSLDMTDSVRREFLEFLQALFYGGGIVALSADPADPENGRIWIVASGTSPSRTIALKIRDQGVTQEIISIVV